MVRGRIGRVTDLVDRVKGHTPQIGRNSRVRIGLSGKTHDINQGVGRVSGQEVHLDQRIGIGTIQTE